MKQVLLSFIIIILSNAALNAQLPANPTYELVQNGYTGVDSTLAGAIFDLSITDFCSGIDKLTIEFDSDKLDFVGGVDTSLYEITGNFIQLTSGNNTCILCDPIAIGLQFRFKSGITCNGETSEFTITGFRECPGESTIFFPPESVEISAIANNYWVYEVTERDPNLSSLAYYEREWLMQYWQDFSEGVTVNGITASGGLGTYDLKMDSVKINLVGSSCTETDLAITGYNPYNVLNFNSPNINYTAISNPTSTYDYKTVFNDGVLPSSGTNSIFNFFVKGEILTCESCNYSVYFDTYAELMEDCDDIIIADTITGYGEYQQTVFTFNGELDKRLRIPAYTHLAPGCSGEFFITFKNRGNTILDSLILIDTFPTDLLDADNMNIEYDTARFDMVVMGNIITFTLKDGQTVDVDETILILIPFTVLTTAIPDSIFVNKIFAEFDSEFPEEIEYDHCGSEIVIPAAPGVSYDEYAGSIAIPNSVASILKCTVNSEAVNVDEEQEFIIYVTNNGSEDLNTTVTDFLTDNNLEDITNIQYYTGTRMSTNYMTCNFNIESLTDSLTTGYSAEFDSVDSWDVSIPANCDFGEYNILAIKFEATQLPALSGRNCAEIDGNILPTCTYYGINKLGRLEVRKTLNSESGLSDWEEEYEMNIGNIFEYRIVVTNTGSVATLDTIVIRDEFPDCVEISTATLNGDPVAAGNEYFFPEPLLPGDSIVLIVKAEYLGSIEDCINTARARGYTEMSSNPLNPFSNEAIIKMMVEDSCDLVDIVINDSYIVPGDTPRDRQCCFELYYSNQYPDLGAFRSIGYQVSFTPPTIASFPSAGFIAEPLFFPPTTLYNVFRPTIVQSIPNNQSPQPFITVCYYPQQTNGAPINLDFHWFSHDSAIVCTTPVILECDRSEELNSKLNDENLLLIENLEVELFPNPTQNLLNLKLNKPVEEVDILIYSMNGQVIMAAHADFTDKQSSLDVSNLADGVYIIKVVLESGESKVMKFVKMH